ncbi:MAG: hypothetical protein ACLPQS_13230 [Acidimicrobiales bacterium]
MTDTDISVEASDQRALVDVVNLWLDAWNEEGAERRRTLIEGCWVPGGRYADPFLEAAGAEAITSSLGQLRALFPGYSVRRKSGIEFHFGRLRFAWVLLDPGGSVVGDGIDIAELSDDGRFQHLVTFVGETVAVPLEG